MESPESSAEKPVDQPKGSASQDIVLSLNFVPAWARQPAAGNPYADRDERDGGSYGRDRRDERPDSRDDRRGPRREFRGREGGGRPGGGGQGRGGPRDGRRPGGNRPGGPRPAGARPTGDRPSGAPTGEPRRFDGPRGDRRRDDRGPRRDFAPRLPIQVAFVPERNHLGIVVKEMHEKQRAYPLAMIASLFLQKPENHMVKIEVTGNKAGPDGLKLWQNTKTGMIFMSREVAQNFAVARDLEEFFEKQEIPCDPPAGNFQCVGRCGMSGELLGPPNYHGFQERLQELHRTRFSHIPLDDYRGKVEMVRDPAVVEQWKEQSKSIRRYRDKTDPEGPATLKRSEAEFRFLEKYAKDLFKQGQRFLVPGQRAPELPDPALRNIVREAWVRESRFPMSLMFALRPAFRHMRLHLFKVGNETFVTAVQPKPMDASHSVENIQKMLQLLREHPGWTRKDLVEHMQPGLALESAEAAELLKPLRWLIEKGHVIEFFNGTLSLPAAPQPQPSAKPAAPAAAAPEAAGEAAAPAVAAETPTVEAPAAEKGGAIAPGAPAPTVDQTAETALDVPAAPSSPEAAS